MYSPLWKITHYNPSVLCTPPFEKSPIKIHRFCVLPPFEKSPITTHRFYVLPPLKNHPSKDIDFMYSPLWKNHPSKAIGFVYSPLWKSLFMVGAYFGKYDKYSYSHFLWKFLIFSRILKTLFGFPVTVSANESDVTILGDISWVGQNQMPPNMPRCGFKDDDPICLAERSVLQIGSLVAAVVVPVLTVLVSATVAFYCIRKYVPINEDDHNCHLIIFTHWFLDFLSFRYLQDHSDPYWWRILTYEMDFPSAQIGGASSKSLVRSE